MHVNCTTVKYMRCHIALYSKRTSQKFKQQTKVTNISFNFLPQQQFLQHFIKAQLQYTYFLRTDSLLCVGFAVYDCCSFCLSHSPTINPSTQTLQITQTTVAVKCKILVHFGHSFLYILCHFIDVL